MSDKKQQTLGWNANYFGEPKEGSLAKTIADITSKQNNLVGGKPEVADSQVVQAEKAKAELNQEGLKKEMQANTPTSNAGVQTIKKTQAKKPMGAVDSSQRKINAKKEDEDMAQKQSKSKDKGPVKVHGEDVNKEIEAAQQGKVNSLVQSIIDVMYSKNEALAKDDEGDVKKTADMLKKASKAHAAQAKDLEKAVNERELTPRELKRREEIAKKLDLKDFEKRYGKDKGMNVKMAVATKMAKKETEEGTKFYRDVTSKDLLENKYKDAKRGAQHFSKVDETEYVWNFVYDDFGRTKLTTEPDKATHLVYTMEGLDNPKLLKISEKEILDYKKGENNELSKKKER